MKKPYKLIQRLFTVTASLALVIATMTANSTCYCFSYQPDVPDGLRKWHKEP